MYYLTKASYGIGNVVLNYYDFASFDSKESAENYLKAIGLDHVFGVKHINDIRKHGGYHRSSSIIK